MYAARKLLRDAILIATVIGSLLLLFTLQALLSEKFITGDAIQVGRPDQVVIVPPTKPIEKIKPVPVDPKTQCWLDHGLKQEDFAIVGSLLQQTSCATTPKRQPIIARVQNNCLNVQVGSDATTTVCMDQEQPEFSVALPAPLTTPVVVPPTKPNYWLALLLCLIGICILFVWGRADLRSDFYRRRATQDYTRLLPGQAEVEIRYIRPPPLYLKKSLDSAQPTSNEPAALPKIVSVMVERQSSAQPALASPLNKFLVKFNALSQTLCELIAAKKFTEAEQNYPELYRLALEIYSKVTDENKPRLLRVVTSLHEELQQVRKAYAVSQDMHQIYQREQSRQEPVPVQVWKPATITMRKEEVRHLDDSLTKLRHLLEQSRHVDAVKHHKERFLP